MKKLINHLTARIGILLLMQLIGGSPFVQAGQKPSYFQLKVYHFQTPNQEKAIDQFLAQAYIPAMHRLGFKQIGVFKPLDNKKESDKLIYVLSTANELKKFANLDVEILKDAQYIEKGKPYLDAPHNEPPFSRIESILMKAFQGMPDLSIPKLSSDKSLRVYELRSYEGPTEKLSANKISMFNNGEIDIFSNLNFNAVFYGQVIAGSTMPNLMYLTCFENMADREAHWKAFGPPYKAMDELPQYQNNVSKNVTILCAPTSYSDF